MHRETAGQTELVEWVVAARALPGQTVSGDLHLVKLFRNGALVAVVDGVGHGDEATAAARAATATLADFPTEPVIWLVKRCHENLALTRGVVMTLASFRALEGTLSWIGVGNVEGALLRADATINPSVERVLLRGGLIGYQLPPLSASVIPVNQGDVLVLASDGVRSDFLAHLTLCKEPLKQMADRIMANFFKGTDDALVLVARFRGMRHE